MKTLIVFFEAKEEFGSLRKSSGCPYLEVHFVKRIPNWSWQNNLISCEFRKPTMKIMDSVALMTL
jgi:hypothetical protein